MELKSSMGESWKTFALASLVGWIFLIHFFGKTDYNVNLLDATKTLLKQNTNTLVLPSNLSIHNATEDTEKIVTNISDREVITGMKKKKCNMFDGRWVYKPEQDPTYDPLKCPFLEEKMSCKRNGRPDLEYERWVWEADHCQIPLLKGRDMVERLRNKRVILVGDSMNRNMWESLACVLYSSMPSSGAVVRNIGSIPLIILEAKEYNMTVEFYWSPFLTEYSLNYRQSGKRVLVLDRLSPNSKFWAGADIMVFNSGHWWAQTGSYRRWDLLEYEGKLVEDMPLEEAYERGMRTWQTWVQQNVDPSKTTVFFRSYSAEHKGGGQWCYKKTQPLIDESYIRTYPTSLANVVESVVKEMRKPKVKYLNITKLSEYRIDAHPAMYRYKDWKNLTKVYQNNLQAYADCGHWCLPGVPDTWNRLLYTSLFFDTSVGDISNS